MAAAIRLSSSASATGALVTGKLVGAVGAALGRSGVGALLAASVGTLAVGGTAVDITGSDVGCGADDSAQAAKTNTISMKPTAFLRITTSLQSPGNYSPGVYARTTQQNKYALYHCRLQITNCKVGFAYILIYK